MLGNDSLAGAGYGGVSAAQGAPQRQSHVSGQTDRLERISKDLMENLSHLESRIEPVLRLEPSATQQGEKENAALVAYAEKIGGIASTLEGANRRLLDIIGRIEL